jgi:hypothetical protein
MISYNINVNKNYLTKYYLKNGYILRDTYDSYDTCFECSRVNFDDTFMLYYKIIDFSSNTDGICIFDSRDFDK